MAQFGGGRSGDLLITVPDAPSGIDVQSFTDIVEAVELLTSAAAESVAVRYMEEGGTGFGRSNVAQVKVRSVQYGSPMMFVLDVGLVQTGSIIMGTSAAMAITINRIIAGILANQKAYYEVLTARDRYEDSRAARNGDGERFERYVDRLADDVGRRIAKETGVSESGCVEAVAKALRKKSARRAISGMAGMRVQRLD